MINNPLLAKQIQKRSVTVLIADDDPDDSFLTEEALKESRIINDIRKVSDGEELMDYLLRQGPYSDPQKSPTPGIILLDLNMPKKDGRQALAEIKADHELRHIPVVVLTTSKAEEDIYKTYNLGVNSFITKPVGFDAFADLMRTLGKYWFEVVELPANCNE